MYLLPNSSIGTQAERVSDETILVLLDPSNHCCLLFGRAVVVDDTETTMKSESDGHSV